MNDDDEPGLPVRDAATWEAIMSAELDDDALHRPLELDVTWAPPSRSR